MSSPEIYDRNPPQESPSNSGPPSTVRAAHTDLGFKIYDITPLISERLGVFPGDTPFKRHKLLSFEQGQHLLLSSITSTLHIGAHADGPNHYLQNGEGIAARDLNLYLGDCLVLHAKRSQAGARRVGWKDLDPKWHSSLDWPASRVIVRTDSFPDPENWNSDFDSFAPQFIQDLSDRGVKLIGIDTPSIDPEDSKELESHQTVAKNNLAILEGVVLTDVEEGLYTLIALPLKIEGADAGPLRAVLIGKSAIL